MHHILKKFYLIYNPVNRMFNDTGKITYYYDDDDDDDDDVKNSNMDNFFSLL